MEELRTLKLISASIHQEDDEDEMYLLSCNIIERERKFLRRRWDSKYLIDLAQREGSFIAEYRVDPKGYDILVDMIDHKINRNEIKAINSLGSSGSRPISVASRLGICLIMLAGGR